MTKKQLPATGLITTREAAEIAGVSTRTIQLWTDAGELACCRTVGGHRRLNAAEVHAMVAAKQTVARGQQIGLIALTADEIADLRGRVETSPNAPVLEDVVRMVEQAIAGKNGMQLRHA